MYGDAYLPSRIEDADHVFVPTHRGPAGVVVEHGGDVLLGHGQSGEDLRQAGLPHHPVPNHGTADRLLHVINVHHRYTPSQ